VRGLPEGEQWFFSKLLLDNLLLLRQVVKMTRMSAKPLAQLSRLWRYGSCSAAHPHFGTSSRKSDTRGLRILKGILRASQPYWRVYANKDIHEAVFVNIWIALHLQVVHN